MCISASIFKTHSSQAFPVPASGDVDGDMNLLKKVGALGALGKRHSKHGTQHDVRQSEIAIKWLQGAQVAEIKDEIQALTDEEQHELKAKLFEVYDVTPQAKVLADAGHSSASESDLKHDAGAASAEAGIEDNAGEQAKVKQESSKDNKSKGDRKSAAKTKACPKAKIAAKAKASAKAKSAQSKTKKDSMDQDHSLMTSVLEKNGDAVNFVFVSADKIRERSADSGPLPTLQTLEKMPGWTQRIPIGFLGCLSGLYVGHILAISHRWEDPNEPDPAGDQFKAIRSLLLEHQGFKWVWYDYWCMYQSTKEMLRNGAQQAAFIRMLQQVNFLYLGCSVFVLLDKEYYERFWPNFESWLAMQTPGPDGLSPAKGASSMRCTIKALGDGTDEDVDQLRLKWTHKAKEGDFKRQSAAGLEGTSNEDDQVKYVLTALADDKILVTNKGDKKRQLYKVSQLHKDIKEAMGGPSADWTSKVTASLQKALEEPDDRALWLRIEEGKEASKWFQELTVNGATMNVHCWLFCKGCQYGWQFENWYGDWELDPEQPIIHERPHYRHPTMSDRIAHLYHVVDPNYNVPRWVMGMEAGDDNGWAFCESDALVPHSRQNQWISWDGFKWSSTRDFIFVAKEGELDGLSDEETDEFG